MGPPSRSVGRTNRPGRSPRAAPNDTPYYIYASSAGSSPGQNIQVLSPGSTTDEFVASLNEQKVLILSGTPSPAAALHDSDETKKWIQQLDPNAACSLEVDGTAQKNVSSFDFAFSHPWPLTFSSASDVLLFTFGAPAVVDRETGGRIEPPGIDADGEMLTCGLDFAHLEEITGTKLKDLFTYADAAGMSEYVPSTMLDLLVTLEKPAKDDPPKRNALWFVPSSDKRVDVRLQFRMPVFDALQHLLADCLKGLTLKASDVIFRKQTLLAVTEEGEKPLSQGGVAFSIDCAVKADDGEVSMVAGIEFSPSAINLTFIFVSENPLSGILKWLGSLIGDESLEGVITGILDKEENGTKVLPDFTLRRLTVELSTLTDPNKPKLSSFAFDIEVSANFGGGSSQSPVIFLISYHWNSFSGGLGTLAGQLWNDFDPSQDLDLLPDQEKWTILRPLATSPAASIDMATLIPTQTVMNIPDTLPSQITRAYVELSQDSFTIRCTATANPISPGSAPQPYLGEVTLDASFAWGQSTSFTLDVAVNAMIVPSENSAVDVPAVLTGSLSYDSSAKSWGLKGSISGLYASTLVEFFEQDAKDHVGPLIQSIAIDTLTAEYKYEPRSGGSDGGHSRGSEFTISGDLLIASFRLSLEFRHDKDGFLFSAALNPRDKEASATVGDVLAATLGSEIELPDFVYNTVLVGDNEDVFKIVVEKRKTTVNAMTTESFQFLAQLNIGQLHIDFAQLHNTEWAATAPSKRLVKVAINGFAAVEIDIPLVGTLVQPLDELYFLWVQDPQQTQQTGLTRLDIDQLNSSLSDPIMVKDKIKPEQQKPRDVLVVAGCRFAVIIRSTTGERSCLLDYDFMKQRSSTSRTGKASVSQEAGVKGTKGMKAAGADDGGPSAQAPYKKAAGPLFISNVGLKYQDKKLAIMFDATFQLGPIGFALLGFSLAAEFETLDKFPSITPNLEGLATSFDRPPLSMAGIIRHGNDGLLDYFAGGMVVGWRPYEFQAAGFYGTMAHTGGSGGFRTVFVFAKLNGPLVTFQFAEIASVCGGFGYNSSVRVPTIDQVYQFPFIASQGLSGTENAMQVLDRLVDPGPGGWFQPLDKVYWAALGMRVKAFQMLSVDAVVVVQFGASIKLGLFAVALGGIPTADSRIKLAHVEMGISAVVDFDYGTLKIESQLSPRSFILSQDCHLTGGAALYCWFDAPHADQSRVGQFVFTLGGYHQAYRVPIGFPNPPRLGISWSLGGGLTISGQAYFAITPKACMAGGRLHASFSAGPISAWFDAFADFLINYKPFYFDMQAGVSVGVGFSIDIWFIHIRISVEIGAQLYLWGPPVAGRVHVDFWIVAFDINFGDYSQYDDKVSLSEFYLLVLQTSSPTSMASADRALLSMGEEREGREKELKAALSRPRNEGHNFLAQSGLMNPTDKPEREQNEPWIVRAGTFSFIVECKMAINAVRTEDNRDAVITHGDSSKGIDVFSKPMRLTNPMTSTLTVQVKQDSATDPDDGWQYDKYLKSVPRGLWSKYDPRTDPRSSGNNIGELLSGDDGGMPLMMGVQITAPKPTMSLDPFPAFKVADADLQRLLAERPFPTMADSDAAWAPAKPYTGTEVSKQYDAVYDTWTSPALGTGDDGQRGFVGALAESFKWEGVGGLKEIAGIPERLKRGFMTLYVAAPLLTA